MKEQQPEEQVGNLEGRQLIITLSFPEGEIVRIEFFDQSGRRYQLLDREFAALVGDYDVEGLLPVLEQAYVAGFYDANGDFEPDDNESEFDDDPEPVVGRKAASRRLIRREVRKLILGRLLRREFLKVRCCH